MALQKLHKYAIKNKYLRQLIFKKYFRNIESTLGTMSKWQRVLEREKYVVTASLVMVAVYQICANYMKVISNVSTRAPVKALTKKLLKDFDERYHPTDYVSGKVSYTGKSDIGFHDRYIGVHPYLVIASMLDPRIKGMLPRMMETNQYNCLKEDVIAFMLEQKKEHLCEQQALKDEQSDANAIEAAPGKQCTVGVDNDDSNDDMFGDLEKNNAVEIDMTPDEVELKNQCEVELEAYLTDKGMKLRKENPKKEFNDPLEWWKENEHTYSVLAELSKLFLYIPASSAPSELIWSRDALVLSSKQGNMNEELASGIMFVKENLKLLKQYYAEVTKDFKNALPLQFTGLPDCFNIKAEDEIDVGQDLF